MVNSERTDRTTVSDCRPDNPRVFNDYVHIAVRPFGPAKLAEIDINKQELTSFAFQSTNCQKGLNGKVAFDG